MAKRKPVKVKASRAQYPGEIGVAAAAGPAGGKLTPITLNPLRVLPVTVDLRQVESTLPCGLRQMWVSGTDGPRKFEMSAGAGCGSRWLTLTYDGRYYCVDMTETLARFLDAIKAADHKAKREPFGKFIRRVGLPTRPPARRPGARKPAA